MEVIPAVDVLDGAVVRLRRGDYGEVTRYGDDPAEAVGRWGGEGAALVHVVDLAAARSGRGDPGLWARVAEAGVPFQAAGGIRDAAAAERAAAAGAARVIVGTAAIWDPEVLAGIVAEVGGARVVGAVDVRDGRARGAGWEDEGRPVDAVVEEMAAAGVGRLMVTGISRDGTMAGPDLALQRRAAGGAPVPVIASGGVGTLEHLVEGVTEGHASAVLAASIFHFGIFTIREAKEHMAAAGIPVRL